MIGRLRLLDTTTLAEITYDDGFRLHLKALLFPYSKAKFAAGHNRVDLDIEIQFFTSYFTKEGNFYSYVLLGIFTRYLTDVTINNDEAIMRFKNTALGGWCKVVPHS